MYGNFDAVILKTLYENRLKCWPICKHSSGGEPPDLPFLLRYTDAVIHVELHAVLPNELVLTP